MSIFENNAALIENEEFLNALSIIKKHLQFANNIINQANNIVGIDNLLSSNNLNYCDDTSIHDKFLDLWYECFFTSEVTAKRIMALRNDTSFKTGIELYTLIKDVLYKGKELNTLKLGLVLLKRCFKLNTKKTYRLTLSKDRTKLNIYTLEILKKL